jgi:hypothetical protein
MVSAKYKPQPAIHKKKYGKKMGSILFPRFKKWICKKRARRQSTFLGFVWDLHGICLGFTWDLARREVKTGNYLGLTWECYGNHVIMVQGEAGEVLGKWIGG